MLLPVQVTFRNMKEVAGLEELVQKEAAKLERFYHRISSCRVVVERPQHADSGKLYHVGIDLGLPGSELVVKHMPTLHGTLQDEKQGKSRQEAESDLAHKTPEFAIRDAFRHLRRQLQDYARKQDSSVKTLQKMPEATVKEIFPAQGYGFLETADDRRIYFHQASVLHGHFNRLHPGTRVQFAEEAGHKGPQASTVKILHPRKQAAAAEAAPRKLVVARQK